MIEKRFMIPTAIMVAALIAAAPMAAQTCKIRCGVTSDGRSKYKEVYEYDYVNEKPGFPGGDAMLISFINQTREYPKEAYKKGITGRVTCSFVVNPDGTISNVQVLKGVEPSLNREAVRIFNVMPQWTPGKIDNTPVPVRVIRSISFRK